ncbi:MAG: discoidin domain-containing protein [Candidatus Bathyarchaeaceae archaeon]
MKKLLNKKGQFSIVAALLVAIVLVAAIITTYSIIRNNPVGERPQVLGSIDEMNLAINHILEFVIGYYGSILQVTGNTTYARSLATNYLQSGLENIAYTHPHWSPSFQLHNFQVIASWWNRTSYTQGAINVTYDLVGLGIKGIQYAASAGLEVTVNPSNTSSVLINVTRDGNKPYPNLGKNNFLFYNYSYTELAWELNTGVAVNSVSSNTTYSVYNITIPSGLDPKAYMVQVSDYRGIMVSASTFSHYTYTFTWNQTLYSSLSRDTIAVEALQNGTLRWLDQNLLTYGKPIPPIPVKALHVNQTVNGVNREVPFQVEDWGSNYRVPLGLTSNSSIFTSRNMLVFLINHRVQKVTLWWDGRDNANQTSYAWENRYFTVDTVQRTLTNTILTLKIDFSSNTFKVISTVGTTQSTAEFMRINNDVADYGHAEPTYAIPDGTVRAVVQHEVEWGGGGVSGGLCPNVYAQIVLTLPANATYYTYALRLIFVDSSRDRTITDLSPIQLSSGWMTGLRSLTENGTSDGFPIIGETFAGQNNLFYNFSSPSTGWEHHWSEYISGSAGAGIMFTDSSNLKLYAFDNLAGAETGALSITTEQRTVWKTPTAVYNKCDETSPYFASHAIDGSTLTYWRHSAACYHWIILDMGQTMNISRVRIYQRDYDWGGSAGIEVYISDDPDNWGSAAWTGRIDGDGWEYSGQFQALGRYVKLVSKSNSSSQRLYEVQVEVQERQTTIEFNPVERYQVSFQYPLDITWSGAVVTFEDEPIYPTSGTTGLWVLVEHPPTVTVS